MDQGRVPADRRRRHSADGNGQRPNRHYPPEGWLHDVEAAAWAFEETAVDEVV